MKKEYEKPVLELVEFEILDAIATSCADDVTRDSTGKECVTEGYDGFNLFSGKSEGCEPYEGYCYYPSSFSLINS